MQMRSLHIRLQDDIVVSRGSATTGEHETLDFIPGATLLGVAAQFYNDYSPQEQWLVFHSGKVRFGNAYPITVDGERSYPMPMSLHYPKVPDADPSAAAPKKVDSKRKVLANDVRNLAAASRDEVFKGKQPKQMRSHYLSTQGEILKVAKGGNLKTAIDPETGRIKDGQLFGYQTLRQGQLFSAQLQADADVPVALLQKLSSHLQRQPRIGRSRSAQFGRVDIQIRETVEPVTAGKVESNRLILWLLSDVALLDNFGNSSLNPEGALIGLTGAKLQPSQSFIRTRSYSPYNAFRRSYDTERQVISAGSVLVYHLSGDITAAQIQALASGIGAYREAGLGQIWVNPPLLANATVATAKLKEPAAAAQVKAPTTGLIAWLKQQPIVDNSEVDSTVRTLITELAGLYRTARQYVGALRGVEIGPGKTQWGRVGNVAKLSDANAENIMQRLFGDDPQDRSPKDGRVCKGDDWSTDTFEVDSQKTGHSVNTTFAIWLHKRLDKHKNGADFVLLVQKLARQASSTTIDQARAGLRED
jgi:CRISPR-associated protein Csx10